MVVMRLARVGRKKLPLYRVVIADQRKAATGKFIDIVGRYNPHTKDIVLDKEKIEKWLKVGAQPSNTVAKILQTGGVKLPSWVKIKQKNKSVKNEEKAQERANKGVEQQSSGQSQEGEPKEEELIDVASDSTNETKDEVVPEPNNSDKEELKKEESKVETPE